VERKVIVMDDKGKILQLQGRLGGLSRALKKVEREKKELAQIVLNAKKIADDHRELCAKVAGNENGCKACIALNNCWEINLLNALMGVEDK